MPLQCNVQARFLIASGLLEVCYTIAKQRRRCSAYEPRTLSAEQTLTGNRHVVIFAEWLQDVERMLEGSVKSCRRSNLASWQTLILSFVCAVDWSSALAASAQQTAGTVGTPYQNITSLLSLRNFTTEQRGTTVLCVRKLDKVMQMQYPIIEQDVSLLQLNIFHT